MGVRVGARRRIKAIRWVSDDSQPGVVEISMNVAHGTEWRFVDKTPISALMLSHPKLHIRSI
jgi:hypothetical protein